MLDLRFAEYVSLTTEGVKDMEHQFNNVNEESFKICLTLHEGKTKIMININTTDNMHIDGTEIEKVTNYKYIGQTIAMKNKTRQEVFDTNKSGMECYCKEQRNLSR